MDDLTRGVLRAESYTRRVLDPSGPYPACRSAVGTRTCERCGRDTRGAKGPCPAARPEDRWRFEEEETTPTHLSTLRAMVERGPLRLVPGGEWWSNDDDVTKWPTWILSEMRDLGLVSRLDVGVATGVNPVYGARYAITDAGRALVNANAVHEDGGDR